MDKGPGNMSIEQFNDKGYTLIKNYLNKDLRDVITQYALFDEMQDFKPDGFQVPNAHSKYADPAMEAMLLHLHPLMEGETGLSLYPTYSFYRVYRNGDVLKPHKDRESCEISATVCFNYSYDDNLYSWPILIEDNKIKMYPGDIAIYRGVELEHSREEFAPPDDSWHVQAFFHYVDSNGPYSEFIYDKRQSIGSIEKKVITGKKYIEYTEK
jgi:hypothetical protein